MKWWEDKVDEMFIGLVIGAVCFIAVLRLDDGAVPVVTSGISALGVYLGTKVGKNGNSGNKINIVE